MESYSGNSSMVYYIECSSQSWVGVSRNMSGTLEDRYAIYVDCMKDSGEYIKTFDEWLET